MQGHGVNKTQKMRINWHKYVQSIKPKEKKSNPLYGMKFMLLGKI